MKSTHVSHLLLLAVLAMLAGPSDAAVTSCEAACRPGDVSCLRGCFPVPAGRLLRRQGRQRGGSRRGKAADIRNNRQAQIQNQQDDAANEAADQGQDAPAVGGIGGVDPATGQVLEALPPPSNFCRQSGQSLADGTQQQGGFCSSVPQGQIPEVNKMVSSLIIEPDNNANIGLGEGFRVTVLSRNLNTGFFTVAASEYYTQPQTLNDQGIVQGHQHVTIQRLASLTEAPDANQKDFFQGLNDAAGADGSLFVDVPAGTLNTPGTYRICSMSGAFSHQPTVMPIAQRGAQDDCIRVNVGGDNGDGNDAANAGGNGAGNANANAVGNGAGNNAGNGAGNNAGNGAGNNAGNGAGNNAGNGAGNGAGNNAGNGAGNNAGNGAGNNAGNGAGNNAGNGAGNNRGGGRFGGFGNRGAAGRGVGGRLRV